MFTWLFMEPWHESGITLLSGAPAISADVTVFFFCFFFPVQKAKDARSSLMSHNALAFLSQHLHPATSRTGCPVFHLLHFYTQNNIFFFFWTADWALERFHTELWKCEAFIRNGSRSIFPKLSHPERNASTHYGGLCRLERTSVSHGNNNHGWKAQSRCLSTSRAEHLRTTRKL